MNILIIYAHPDHDSFTHQVLTFFTKGLRESSHTFEISDLYQMDFQTDLSPQEYKRESTTNTKLPIPSDVQLEHQKINRADCICFIYPVWWSDCPAKLKGWFDRVWTAGFAYSKDDQARGMPTISKGLVICPAGHPMSHLVETGVAESMRKIMLEDRLGSRFERKEMLILDNTLEGDEVKQVHLEKIYQVGLNIGSNFLTH